MFFFLDFLASINWLFLTLWRIFFLWILLCFFFIWLHWEGKKKAQLSIWESVLFLFYHFRYLLDFSSDFPLVLGELLQYCGGISAWMDTRLWVIAKCSYTKYYFICRSTYKLCQQNSLVGILSLYNVFFCLALYFCLLCF